MCDRACYESRQEARGQSRAYERQGFRRMRAYSCPRCGYWHLTSMSRKRGKKARKRGRAYRHRADAR